MRTLATLTAAERIARLEIKVERLEAVADDVEEMKKIVERGRGIKWLLGLGWIGFAALLGKTLYLLAR
jgi:hypothetical protein